MIATACPTAPGRLPVEPWVLVSSRSSYHAVPVASPHPPNRQLMPSDVWLPLLKVTSTRFQSLVPTSAGVLVPWMLWMLISAPSPLPAAFTSCVLIHADRR